MIYFNKYIWVYLHQVREVKHPFLKEIFNVCALVLMNHLIYKPCYALLIAVALYQKNLKAVHLKIRD